MPLFMMAMFVMSFKQSGITVNGVLRHDDAALYQALAFLSLFVVIGIGLFFYGWNCRFVFDNEKFEIYNGLPNPRLKAFWSEVESISNLGSLMITANGQMAKLPSVYPKATMFAALLKNLPSKAFPPNSITAKGYAPIDDLFSARVVAAGDYFISAFVLIWLCGTGAGLSGAILTYMNTDDLSASGGAGRSLTDIIGISAFFLIGIGLVCLFKSSFVRMMQGKVDVDGNRIKIFDGIHSVEAPWSSVQWVSASTTSTKNGTIETLTVLAGDQWFEVNSTYRIYQRLKDLILSRTPEGAHVYVGL